MRAIGLSNFSEEQIRVILDICEVKPSVLQTEVHPYSQEKGLKEFLAKENIYIQAENIVIPGSKNPAHIKDNFDLFDFALTDDEMNSIAALDQQMRYYHSTPELLEQYVHMVPPVDEQK